MIWQRFFFSSPFVLESLLIRSKRLDCNQNGSNRIFIACRFVLGDGIHSNSVAIGDPINGKESHHSAKSVLFFFFPTCLLGRTACGSPRLVNPSAVFVPRWPARRPWLRTHPASPRLRRGRRFVSLFQVLLSPAPAKYRGSEIRLCSFSRAPLNKTIRVSFALYRRDRLARLHASAD